MRARRRHEPAPADGENARRPRGRAGGRGGREPPEEAGGADPGPALAHQRGELAGRWPGPGALPAMARTPVLPPSTSRCPPTRGGGLAPPCPASGSRAGPATLRLGDHVPGGKPTREPSPDPRSWCQTRCPFLGARGGNTPFLLPSHPLGVGRWGGESLPCTPRPVRVRGCRAARALGPGGRGRAGAAPWGRPPARGARQRAALAPSTGPAALRRGARVGLFSVALEHS